MAQFDATRIARTLAVAAALALAGMNGCRRPASESTAESTGQSAPAETGLTNVTATLRRFPIDAETFVLIPDARPDERYLPDNLPSVFREDGLQVIFSGERRAIPTDDRLVGAPIHLTRIERRDGARRS